MSPTSYQTAPPRNAGAIVNQAQHPVQDNSTRWRHGCFSGRAVCRFVYLPAQTRRRHRFACMPPPASQAGLPKSRVDQIFNAAQCGWAQKFPSRRSRRAWWSLALFDRFLGEAKRGGVLDQRPNFRLIQTGWNFGIDLECQDYLAAGKGCELLDDGLDNLMDVPRRALR